MLIQFVRSVVAMTPLCSSILPLIPAIIDFDCVPTPERWADYKLTKLIAFMQTRFFRMCALPEIFAATLSASAAPSSAAPYIATTGARTSTVKRKFN